MTATATERDSLTLNLLEKVTYPVTILERDSVIFANPSFMEFLGYESKKELIGLSALDLFEFSSPKNQFLNYLNDLKTDEVTEYTEKDFEGVFKKKNGKPIGRNFGVHSINFQGVSHTMIVVEDLASHIKMQGYLDNVDNLVSMGMVSASVAHELKNPLSYIMTNLDFMEEQWAEMMKKLGDAATPEQLEFHASLMKARDGLDRVQNIVSEIKTFSKTGEEITPLDVHEVIETAVAMANVELGAITKIVRSYRAIPLVRAKEAKLGQVFVNVLLNAAQSFSGDFENNFVEIFTDQKESGRITIEFRDTGPGICEENLERVFEPFYTTKTKSGTGLGLCICRKITKEFNGEIDVKSVLGKGTSFIVTLDPHIPEEGEELPEPKMTRFHIESKSRPPVKEEVKAEFEIKRERSEISTEVKVMEEKRVENDVVVDKGKDKQTVLIVDDEPDLLDSLQWALSKDFEVLVAGTGREALEILLRRKDVSKVLCDISMPEVSGIELFEILKDDHPGLEKKLIFMTGGACTERAAYFLNTVENPKVDKPFQLKTIRSLLGVKKE